jgi:hypothetical protein
MAKATLALLVPMALAACSPEPPPASRNAGDERAAATPGAAAGAAAPRLARLKDSAEGDSAAHYGTLEVAGRCIHVVAEGSRSLIASTVPGSHWDAAEGVLVAGGARLRPGTRIFLAGSFAPLANLEGQWVDPPAEECLTSRVWVASSIRPR